MSESMMIVMRAIDTAARRRGSGLVWLWAGELADLVELQLCPWRKR